MKTNSTNESKHTLGKWTLNARALAHLHNGDIVAELYNRPLAECEAAAQLIASAPDLLKQRDVLIQRRNELADALTACVITMNRTFPNGLPVQQGTLNEEQEWDLVIREARAALAQVESEVGK